jgi:hypothetical protein
MHGAGVEIGLLTSVRSVNELVRNHERAGPELGPQTAHGAGREDLSDAQ